MRSYDLADLGKPVRVQTVTLTHMRADGGETIVTFNDVDMTIMSLSGGVPTNIKVADRKGSSFTCKTTPSILYDPRSER